MSILLNDEALCCGARRLAVQLAAALPALRRAGLGPLRIYLQRGGDFQEVSL